MPAEIRRRLAGMPFVPFSIRMADGREYPVPTLDHLWLPLGGSRVIVADDEGATAVLPALLISGLVESSRQQDVPNV